MREFACRSRDLMKLGQAGQMPRKTDNSASLSCCAGNYFINRIPAGDGIAG